MDGFDSPIDYREELGEDYIKKNFDDILKE